MFILSRSRLNHRVSSVLRHIFCFALAVAAVCGSTAHGQSAPSQGEDGYDNGFSSIYFYDNSAGGYSSNSFYPGPPSYQGNSVTIVYTGQGSGLQLMVVWDATTQEWTSMTLKSSGTIVTTWVDGGSQGHPGSLIKTSGSTAGVFTFTASSGVTSNYVQDGNILEPAQTPDSQNYTGFQPDLQSFRFNGLDYQSYSSGLDYQGNTLKMHQAGTNSCLVRYNESGLFQLAFPGVGTTRYQFDPTSFAYSLKSAPTAIVNSLSQVNSISLVASASGSTFAAPTIKSFVWNAKSYSLLSPSFSVGAVRWKYSGSSGGAAYAYYTSTGQFDHLTVTDGGSLSETITAATQANVYLAADVNGYDFTTAFTAFNNIPYVLSSGQILPRGPINQFTYGSSTYSYSSYSVLGNNWVANYRSPTGQTATVEYSPNTGATVKLTVHPSGQYTNATYVDGASVGRPGAYVLSTNSSAPNLLTAIDSQGYTPNGDMATKVNALVNNNGVFDINGNFMTLGIWSNNSNHVGFSLSYDDGVPVTVPASIDFTASRPLSHWTWNAATADDTGTTPMMMLDEGNRLSLYPAGSTAPGSPAVPSPTVVLNPSTNGVSQFDGVVRFQQAVRIEPQGDLSMGEFTQDSFSSANQP